MDISGFPARIELLFVHVNLLTREVTRATKCFFTHADASIRQGIRSSPSDELSIGKPRLKRGVVDYCTD